MVYSYSITSEQGGRRVVLMSKNVNKNCKQRQNNTIVLVKFHRIHQYINVVSFFLKTINMYIQKQSVCGYTKELLFLKSLIQQTTNTLSSHNNRRSIFA